MQYHKLIPNSQETRSPFWSLSLVPVIASSAENVTRTPWGRDATPQEKIILRQFCSCVASLGFVLAW